MILNALAHEISYVLQKLLKQIKCDKEEGTVLTLDRAHTIAVILRKDEVSYHCS